jgi:hypothetical protein
VNFVLECNKQKLEFYKQKINKNVQLSFFSSAYFRFFSWGFCVAFFESGTTGKLSEA